MVGTTHDSKALSGWNNMDGKMLNNKNNLQ